MSLSILREVGLSDGEIRVYSALLDIGITSLNRIHEKTGIERRNIYDILNKLIERGLVTYVTENNKRLFRAVHPSKILDYLEDKKEALEETKKAVEKELPSFIQKFELAKPSINAEIYRGIEGIKTVWEDMLNYKAIYWIAAGRYVPKRLPTYYENWTKRRLKKGIKIYNLLRYELRKEAKPYPLEEWRFLPKAFSGNPTVLGVHGNKAVNYLLGEDFFAFVVESKELAENYKRYHKYLWEHVAKR
ncbi:MAG: helix-turn-helix domain-containing protein [Nanoarchaeota archaeon]